MRTRRSARDDRSVLGKDCQRRHSCSGLTSVMQGEYSHHDGFVNTDVPQHPGSIGPVRGVEETLNARPVTAGAFEVTRSSDAPVRPLRRTP
jgi:hypothetical protein